MLAYIGSSSILRKKECRRESDDSQRASPGNASILCRVALGTSLKTCDCSCPGFLSVIPASWGGSESAVALALLLFRQKKEAPNRLQNSAKCNLSGRLVHE